MPPSHRCLACSSHGPQLEVHSSKKGCLHTLHWTIRWCAVVWCHSPRIGHSSRCFCHRAPHPSHLTFPHNHVTHAMQRVPFKGSHDTQCTPGKSGIRLSLINHFLAGRGCVLRPHRYPLTGWGWYQAEANDRLFSRGYPPLHCVVYPPYLYHHVRFGCCGDSGPIGTERVCDTIHATKSDANRCESSVCAVHYSCIVTNQCILVLRHCGNKVCPSEFSSVGALRARDPCNHLQVPTSNRYSHSLQRVVADLCSYLAAITEPFPPGALLPVGVTRHSRDDHWLETDMYSAHPLVRRWCCMGKVLKM